MTENGFMMAFSVASLHGIHHKWERVGGAIKSFLLALRGNGDMNATVWAQAFSAFCLWSEILNLLLKSSISMMTGVMNSRQIFNMSADIQGWRANIWSDVICVIKRQYRPGRRSRNYDGHHMDEIIIWFRIATLDTIIENGRKTKQALSDSEIRYRMPLYRLIFIIAGTPCFMPEADDIHSTSALCWWQASWPARNECHACKKSRWRRSVFKASAHRRILCSRYRQSISALPRLMVGWPVASILMISAARTIAFICWFHITALSR